MPSGSRDGQWLSRHATADTTAVERIALNPQRTNCLRSQAGGEEALCVLIEPRDRQGRLVAAAAPLSIVVLDHRAQGAAARVARWDLSADDIRALGQTSQDQGIYLELPWPAPPRTGNGPSPQAQLEVFVRYTTADGRKLEARGPLDRQVVTGGRDAPSHWNALPPGTLPPPSEEAPPFVFADKAPATPLAAEALLAPPDETAAVAPRSRRATSPPPSDADADLTAQRPTWSPYRY